MNSFNPFVWLEQFEQAGGGFVNDGTSTRFCWVKTCPEGGTAEAGRLYEEMSADPARLAAIQALVRVGSREIQP